MSIRQFYASNHMNDKQRLPTPTLRTAALNLLARREHSRHELRRKLAEKCQPTTADLNALLDTLEAERLLSDARFAEAFTAARVRRGQGPVRIRFELRERGVAEALIQATLAGVAVDWAELARLLVRRRFGDTTANGPDLAKQMRFLHQRGFSGEQIKLAFRAVGD